MQRLDITDRLILHPDARVGVGLNNPTYRLHVNSADATNPLLINHSVSLGETAGDSQLLARFSKNSAGQGINLDIIAERVADNTGWYDTKTRLMSRINDSIANSWIDFIHRTTTDNAIVFGEADTVEWMRIDNGNVGIGTNNPSATLDVKGSTNVGGATTNSPAKLRVTGGHQTDYPSVGTPGNWLTIGTNYGLDIGVHAGTGNGWIQAHRFDGTPTTYRLILQPAGGNVGIGSVAPTGKLHLSDTGRVVLRIEADTDNNNDSHNALIHMSQDGGAVNAWIGLEGNSGQTFAGSASNAIVIGGSYSGSPIQFATQSDVRMWIETNGNVGIGAAPGSYKLDIAGTMRVSGISTFNDHIEMAVSKGIFLGGTLTSHYLGITGNAAESGIIAKNNVLAIGSTTVRKVRVAASSGTMDFNGMGLDFGGLGLRPVNTYVDDVASAEYVVIYVDASDGDLYVQFPNGVKKLLATNN